MEYAIIALLGIVIVLLIVLLVRKPQDHNAEQAKQLAVLEAKADGLKTTMSDEFAHNRKETADSLKEINTLVREMRDVNEKQTEKVTATLTESVEKLQKSNENKLDQMRQTVDEKLNETLKNRLNESFKLVGDRLESVHKSLGEMKDLASGVSDLQRVLTNVKVRGTWAEVQLGNILEQTLTRDQYDCNVSPKNDNNRVEFAVKIPSREKDGTFVLLPIDSKFPQEDYLRLMEASERADKEGVEAAAKALEQRIKQEAKSISSLYIQVPQTTDFAIMFLATEGLYAEVLRRPGLCEEIQNKYRVLICGPTTITAFLNTLRMGFRTIALDKRAAEVWKVLGAAKTQFGTFETLLAKAKKKIDEAGDTIANASHRNNIIQKHLNNVEQLEPSQADELLGLDSGTNLSDT